MVILRIWPSASWSRYSTSHSTGVSLNERGSGAGVAINKSPLHAARVRSAPIKTIKIKIHFMNFYLFYNQDTLGSTPAPAPEGVQEQGARQQRQARRQGGVEPGGV